MRLEDIRVHIDSVDRDLRKLIEKRMDLAYEVAISKLETSDTIYKPDREQLVISALTKNTRPDIIKEYTALIKKIMLVSREYQYSIMLDKKKICPVDFTSEGGSGKPCNDGSADNEESYPEGGFSKPETHILDKDGYRNIDELFGRIYSAGRFVTAFNRTDDGTAHITTDNTLIGNDRTDRLLLYINAPEYVRILSNVLGVISDFDIRLSWIHTSDDSCAIELEACVARTLTLIMIYMLQSEYDNIYVLGSYQK